MISSLQHTASLILVITPVSIKSLALPSHTSVPWERPDIHNKSENVFGSVSTSIPLTNFVPNSGIPKVPTFEFICSGVTPRAVVDENKDIVSLSSNGIVCGFIPVISWSILITVGSSWPSISSLRRFWSIEW